MSIGSEYSGDIPQARTANEQDLVPPLPPPLQIYRGVVGWVDNDTHFDLGTDSNDGHTFVRVTLNEGIDLNKTPEKGKAHGYQILAHILAGPFYWIPPKGTPVLVAFPDGHIEAPGAGVILGGIGVNPTVQFSGKGAKIDVGPEMNLTLKARRITLMDYQNNYISVGLDTNIVMQTKNGTGGFISDNDGINFYVPENGAARSVFQMRYDKIKLINQTNGTTFIDMSSGKFTCYGDQSMWINGAAVYLGSAPTAANGVAWGLAGPVNNISTGVFVSPV